MVCAEALSCGTPIVGFEAGAPETIAMKEYSEFVPYGDIGRLTEVIHKWLDKEIDKKQLSIEAGSKYGKKTMTDNYIAVYQELLRK
jgi:glycosyltransferase involved in cell wall biosynthesis